MKYYTTALFVLVLPFCVEASPFQNLNFEKAIEPLVMDDRGEVSTSDAVPGWIVYNSGGGRASRMFFDTVSLGEPRVSFHSATSPWMAPIQGKYSVLLQANTFGLTTTAIGQVGEVPVDSVSLRFYGSMSLRVTFAGQPLELVQLSSGAGYDHIGADISAFAGQTGELRFTASDIPVSTFLYLDVIRFSTVAVPEPGFHALMGVGLFGLGWWRRVRA